MNLGQLPLFVLVYFPRAYSRGEVIGLSVFCDIICAVALFLFGITLLGDGLSRMAGSRMESMLRRITDTPLQGFLTGTAVTAVVQSSAAVSILAAELYQSGVLTLRRTIPVLIGANVGTTATAWLLCAARDLPYAAACSAVLAIGGIVLYLMPSRQKWGGVLLGLFLLLTGMQSVTAAVQPLLQSAVLHRLFTVVQNPLWGVLGGMLLTVLVQSSSVSVGLLQALSVGGQLRYAVAIPVVLGQNIGTSLTVFLATLGGKQRAGQAAWAHLLFNIVGTAVALFLMGTVKLFNLTTNLDESVGFVGIAAIHTAFNMVGAALLLPLNEPFAALIERLTARPQSVSANR